jgi:hypothetical protein
MCKILANMTQVSDVAPGPLFREWLWVEWKYNLQILYLWICLCVCLPLDFFPLSISQNVAFSFCLCFFFILFVQLKLKEIIKKNISWLNVSLEFCTKIPFWGASYDTQGISAYVQVSIRPPSPLTKFLDSPLVWAHYSMNLCTENKLTT